MSELVVVSNRGPATLYLDEAGIARTKQAAGGLAPSIAQALVGRDAAWVAAAMTDLERNAAAEGMPAGDGNLDLHLVDIAPEIRAGAYRVISNGVLWFLHHDLYDKTYRPAHNAIIYEAWEQYRSYNQAIADSIANLAAKDATVVVNDYHLCLVGSALLAKRPDLRTVHFSHTPFCTPHELSSLPDDIASELIVGMCSFGACGFHAPVWARNFSDCAARFVDAAPRVFVAPLGVDADELQRAASSPRCVEKVTRLRERLGGRKLLFRSDRIELSKNLIRGFLAFEELLSAHPKWRGQVLFLARAYPSRDDIAEYLAYRNSVEHVVERINERFATSSELPIALEIEDDFETSLAASSIYDALLVNPVRDGMNLVAKEGPVVNNNGGVLMLSRHAGAFEELGKDALAINPFDLTGTARAMDTALSMENDERYARAARLSVIAGGRPPQRWFEDVAANAARASAPKVRSNII